MYYANFMLLRFIFHLNCVTWVSVYRLFELYLSEIDLLVEQARVEGHFDSGIANMKANTIRIKGQPKVTNLLQV